MENSHEKEDEINPLFKLDVVLIFLYQRTGKIFSSEQVTKEVLSEIKADEDEVVLILRKLKKDEYIDEFIIPNPRDNRVRPDKIHGYSISFDGKIFLKQGGYSLKEIRLREKSTQLETLKSDQIQRDEFLKTLTVLIAVGFGATAVYYIYLLWQSLCSCHFVWQK